MKNILVTGGAGFIGSHTCVQLLGRGYDLYVIDSFVNSSPKALEKVLEINKLKKTNFQNKLNIFKGDLLDKDFLNNVFLDLAKTDKKIDGVIHFAGLKSVSESVSDPFKYWQVNLIGSINLLEILDKYHCNTFVFSSSATVYAPNVIGRIKENNTRKPISPYGETKLAIEKILENLFNSDTKKWKIATLRYFNPIGAHESGMIGENPTNKPNNLFPLILKVARGENEYLSIFGNDWPTEDGTCIRDYIHVMDLADAHLAALNFLSSNEPQIVPFNIGTGHGTSVKEIIYKFMEINKVSIPYRYEKRRKGDSASLVADNSRSLELLKWTPTRNISEMCADSWRWGMNF